jgi:periplasmic protein TonB
MMQTGIFEERQKWKGAILLSAGLHLFVALAIILTVHFRGEQIKTWGSATAGEAMSANLVSAVPLPQPEEPTANIVATENKGQTQSLPAPVPKDEPKAIPIPLNEPKHKPQKTETTQAEVKPPPRPVTPPHDNAVPYGAGGPISGPYGAFQSTNVKGGFNFQGGGDFGNRFGWYVQVVNNKVSNNWYTTEIGAAAGARRAYILFDINPDGSPGNVRVEQTSGVPALDQSAVRAVQRIDTFGPTPSGNKVSVEFWFDYQR